MNIQQLADSSSRCNRRSPAIPNSRSQIKVLLAQCYSQLNDPERQRETYLDVLRDNPADVPARLGWIEILIKQGETDRAIEEYEKLVS